MFNSKFMDALKEIIIIVEVLISTTKVPGAWQQIPMSDGNTAHAVRHWKFMKNPVK